MTKRFEASTAGLAAVLLTGAGLLVLTWGTWLDVITDFGRELYVAWRISEGGRLYADVAHFSGPLSPWLNGLAFRVMGPGLTHLVALNVLVLVAFTLAMFRAIRRTDGVLAATAAGIVFLTVLAFGHLVATGNYNWICPYAHESTHGVMLGIAAILALERAKSLGSRKWAAASGFLLGLSLLTRVEPALAAVAACGAGLSVTALRGGFEKERSAALAGALGASALAPVLLAQAFLSTQTSWSDAAASLGRSFMAALSPDLQALPFFRWSLGFDAVGANVATVLLVATLYAAGIGVLAFAALRPAASRYRWAPAAVFVSVAAVFGAAATSIPWWNAARALPVAMAILVFFALRASKESRETRSPDADLRLMLAVWAAVLLGKMLLNARVWQYGFTLAAPATMLAVGCLVGRLPSWIEARRGKGSVFRAGALAFLSVAVVVHLLQSRTAIAGNTHLVGEGADRFWADERGELVKQAVADLARRTTPSETVAVLPEGAMLDYLARRSSSIPYVTINPTEVAIYGEEALLASLRDHPPDYVVFVHKDTSEFGARYFGADYAQSLVRFVMENYTPVARYGATPFTDEGFGILLVKRK